MGKESELLKAVRNNDRNKFQKLLCPDKKKLKHNGTLASSGFSMYAQLHAAPINIDCREEDTGYTPLILAVLNKHREMVESLFTYGANSNAKDSKGNTALHMAVFCGRADLMELLLQNGSQVNIQNSDGNTPLHIACNCDADNRILLLLKLLTARADVYITNKQQATPLDLAAMYNKKDAVSMLLDHDSSLQSNTLAIIEASIRGYAPIVELLLKYGINPNVINMIKGTAPLHEAIRFLRLQVAEKLLQHGAKINLVNSKGETPEQLVKELPQDRPNEFQRLFEEYSTGERRDARVKFDNIYTEKKKRNSMKNYPEIQTNPRWTENSPHYCSCCTALSPNTNILDGDQYSFWIIPSFQQAWTVLDLQHKHRITGVKIYGWDSPEMMKNFELQKGDTIEGPWSTVVHFVCEQKGSKDPKDAGVPQVFQGFLESSRFWRLLIIDNHGGKYICFQGIALYGADERIFSVLQKVNQPNLAEQIIMKGFNSFKKFLTLKESNLKDVISESEKINQILLHLATLAIKDVPLSWKQEPSTEAVEKQVLPPFVIQSPHLTDDLVVVVRGAEVKGQTTAKLVPSGQNQMMEAKFDGVTLTPSGIFLIIVRSKQSPDVELKASQEIRIKPAPKSISEVEAEFNEIQLMLSRVAASLDTNPL